MKRVFIKTALTILILLALSGTVLAQDEPAGSIPEAGTLELHAFYPSFAEYTPQMEKYIDSVDTISFAWSRIYSNAPELVNTTRGANGNEWFYYPSDWQRPIEYAKSKGKKIQLSIYAGTKDAEEILTDVDKCRKAISGIIQTLQQEIIAGKGLYYDGIVIDFEGLRDTSSDGMSILHNGSLISTLFDSFLSDLRTELDKSGKRLFVAVNPKLYYDGYDYSSLLKISDRLILMAHDYEPVSKLTKKEVLEYTGYNALSPVNSNAPYKMVKEALRDIQSEASEPAELKKVWLQLAFDSAQWRFDVKDQNAWESLGGSVQSKEERLSPLYSGIKKRVDNADGFGIGITYGYNNELQTPYIKYYNRSEKTYNIILYEDSTSMNAKVELAKESGIGGISVWSLGNLGDYDDIKGKAFHLDVWDSMVSNIRQPSEPAEGSDVFVTFKDKAVEKAVRAYLGKPSAAISKKEVLGVYRLSLPKETTTLDDLQNLPNLEYLSFQNTIISNLKPLSSLKNLKVLYAQKNMISDISPVRNLKGLEILSFNDNKVSDLTPLGSLTSLKELYVSGNRIANVNPLKSLTGLKILYLNNNTISSTTGLVTLKNLTELGLEGNRISSITGLSGLSRLTFLNVSGNRLVELSSLKGLTALTSLNLSNNSVSDISPLKNLKTLKVLYLQRNLVRSLSSLKGITTIKELSVNGNKLVNLSGIEGMVNLTKLYARDNYLTDISLLKKLKNLNTLYLNGNRIKDFSPFREFYAQLVETDIKLK